MAEEVAGATAPAPGDEKRTRRLPTAPRIWLQRAQPLFLAVALCAAGLALYTWAGDGGDGWNSAPVIVRNPLWALWVASAALVLALLPRPSAMREHAARMWLLLERLSPAIAGVTAVAMLWYVWHCGVFVAAGADASGYVSQSLLWLRGDIVAPANPLTSVAPWSDADWTFVSLGYRPGLHAGTIVPTYAPGLPLLMAAARLIAGPSAVFCIVPLTGLLLLFGAYSLGRHLAGPVAGASAAALVASSPIVLMMVGQPMSDLPAAAFWVAATAVALRTHRTSPLLAGLLASLAVLVRPNLFPLALPLALFIVYRASNRRTALRAMSMLAIGMLPGVALTAAIHATLYGSPLRSGYGSLTDVYSWHHLFATMTAYPARALACHTAFLGLALAAPFLLPASEQRGQPRSVSAFLLVMAAVLFLCYAFYPPFDAWWYLRFVIGSVVWLLVLAAVALIRLIERLPLSVRAPLAVAAISVMVGLLLQRTAGFGVFTVRPMEQRYVVTARWVNEHLPARAVLLSMQHSGSLRYYTERPILRWDLLPPRKLDRALRFVREHGYSPYMVLDCAGETSEFAMRFDGHSELSQLDWPARVRVGGGCTRVFDPADRARYMSGEVLVTEQLR